MPQSKLTQGLLETLEPGVWSSGEALAVQLGVTRTAVWKAVQALKREGFPLEGGARGYRLETDTPVNVPGLEYRGSVGSTMDEARTLARAGTAEFAGVLAELQTSGRGRQGRAWQGAAGSGLYFSLVLRPSVALSSLALLPLLAGACLQRAVHAQTGLEAVLKWSNDLLAPDGRKLAGVLLESEVEDGAARFVILGIGINIRRQDFPAELNAAALEEFVAFADRRAMLEAVLAELKTQYAQFLRVPQTALGLWRSVNGTLGRAVRVLEPSGETWHGTALEVTGDGALLVQTGEGVKTVFAGDVSLRHV